MITDSVAVLSNDTNVSNGDDNYIGAVQVANNTNEQQQQQSLQNSLASSRKSSPTTNDSSFNLKSTMSSADNNEKHCTENNNNNNNEPIKTLKPSLLSSSSASASLSNSPITKSTLWGTPSSHLRSKSNSSGSKLVTNGCSSIVFDFRDNKNIKPNIAIQPTPFGAKPIPKRIIKEIVSNNNDCYDLGHNADDEDDDEDDTNYSGLTETPPPSGIQFKGENVIISNGSLLRKRNKNVSSKLHYFNTI